MAMNPVGAGLAGAGAHWPWSNAQAHLTRRDNALMRNLDPPKDGRRLNDRR
jgi:hypothetical protein